MDLLNKIRKEKPSGKVREGKPPRKNGPGILEKFRKEKPEKEDSGMENTQAKPKGNILDRFRKNGDGGEDDGMDILTDVKEPFSFSGFFETHVVERLKRVKTLLAEKGILFFLFSPFMARGRLIAQMFILFVGVMFGVVPRASSLVNALQEQAYVSEIAGLEEKTVGSLTITPAASSNYKRMHMIAFVVDGKDLPSDSSKYEVHLAKAYGASDWQDVTYSWTIYPITDSRRILLVAIDQSRQASGYGAFDLYIQLAGEEVKDYAKVPFEITLSSAQETTELYDRTGIHLSALTDAVCGRGEISKKQAEFEDALAKYQVAVEQAQAMPVEIEVTPTKDDLETYCMANRVYRELDDDSTTEDILDMTEVSAAPEPDYGVVIKSKGIEYDSAFVNQLRQAGSYSDEDAIIFNAFDSVDEAKKAVIAAMQNVNTESMSWFSTLSSYKLILNQTIRFETFPLCARCTETIDEPINFIDAEPFDPGDAEEPGLSGTMAGDGPYPSDGPVADAPVTDEPPATEEPGAQEPAAEEPAQEPAEEPAEEPAAEKPEKKPEVIRKPAPEPTGNPADNK